MPTPINRFFIENIVPSHTVFYRNGAAVSFDEFSKDVARMANVFARNDEKNIILYIPDDIYLFFVCFMGLMQAGKNVILPGMLTQQNADALHDISNTITTNQKIDLKNFKFIDINQDFGTDWDFCDMDNGLLYFFTSGSTGTPKKICKTFHNLSAEVANTPKCNKKYLIYHL